MSVNLEPLDAASYQSFIEQLCAFANACGREAAEMLLPREVPGFDDPQITLAWEDGYDMICGKVN